MKKALLASAFLLAIPAAALADTPQPSAAVTISDTGPTPRTVSIVAGGSVSWTNAGSGVHTATALPGILLAFDTGGLGHGQAFSASFGVPGTYNYTSTTDCLNGNKTPGFDCGPYSVVVIAPGAPAAAVAPSTSPNVGLKIDDSAGFQPANVTVEAGQAVVWTNSGSNVHTVTADGGYFLAGFDSGGLNPGQTFSYTFSAPGVYAYHSATEPVYFQDPNSGTTNLTYAFKGTITVVGAGSQPVAPAPAAALGSLQFASKEVTAAPMSCGNGNRVPCLASAPNSGTQYVQGHVLDKNGQGIGGLLVELSTPAAAL